MEETGWMGLSEKLGSPNPPLGSYSDGQHTIVPLNEEWGKFFKEGDIRKMCGTASELFKENDFQTALAILHAVRRTRQYHSSQLWFPQVDGMAAMNIGVALKSSGAHVEAIEQYNSALMIARQLGDRKMEAAVLLNIGSIQLLLGGPALHDALTTFASALSLATDVREESIAHLRLGEVHEAMNNYQTALTDYLNSFNCACKCDDKRRQAMLLLRMSTLHNDKLSDCTSARHCLVDCLAIAKEIGDPNFLEEISKRLEEGGFVPRE